jgi:phage-related protein
VIPEKREITNKPRFSDKVFRFVVTSGGFTSLIILSLIALFLLLRGLPVIKDIFKGLGPLIGMLVKAIMPFVKQILNLAKDLIPPIMQAFNILVPIIAKIIKAFQPFMDAVMQLIKDLLPVITELLAGVMDSLAPIVELAGVLAKILFPMIVNIIKSLMPVLMPIFKIFEGIADYIVGIQTGDWSKVGDGLKKIGEGILNLLIFVINKFSGLVFVLSLKITPFL